MVKGVNRHDEDQKKHFGRHSSEEGKPIKSQYFPGGSDKRDPKTIKKGNKL